jgi:hypothetical protein
LTGAAGLVAGVSLPRRLTPATTTDRRKTTMSKKEKEYFNIQLVLGLRRRLEREAEKRDRSLAYIVREALDAYLPPDEGGNDD